MPSMKSQTPHKRKDAGESNRRNLRRRKPRSWVETCHRCLEPTSHELVSIHTRDAPEKGQVYRIREKTVRCMECGSASTTTMSRTDVTPIEYRRVVQDYHVGLGRFRLFEQYPLGSDWRLIPSSSSPYEHGGIPIDGDGILQSRKGHDARWEKVAG